MRRWILLVTFGIACSLIEPVRAQNLVPSENAAAVAFDLTSDFLVVVEGQAGDVGGLRFIVDTGATRTVIDRKVALRLGLKRHTGRVTNFDRSVPIEWAEVPTLQVGPLRTQGLRVTVTNLSDYTEFAKSVDGIIGLDLLGRTQKFTIDYEKKKLYLELAPAGISRPVPGCFVVPVVVQGTTLWLVVDTGLAEILLYKNRLREHSEIRSEGEPKIVIMSWIEGTKVVLPGVQLGGPKKVTAILIDEPAELRTSGLDGYLGIGSLHPTRIEFDFANMALHWE